MHYVLIYLDDMAFPQVLQGTIDYINEQLTKVSLDGETFEEGRYSLFNVNENTLVPAEMMHVGFVPQIYN